MRSRVLLLSLPLLLVAEPSVRADEDADRQTDREIARRHYDKGVAHFDAQRYEQAAVEFEAARAVMPSPAFDYNLGKCYERLERWEEAVAAFERFLAARPDDPDAPAKRERIKVLRQRIAAGKAVKPQKAPDASPPDRAAVVSPARTASTPAPGPSVTTSPAEHDATPGRGTSAAGYALLGVGAASAAAGGVLLGLAAKNSGEVADLYAAGGTWTAHEQSLESAGHTYDLVGPILVGAGAALAVTGAVLAIVGGRREGSSKSGSPSVSLTPLRGGGALVLTCGF